MAMHFENARAAALADIERTERQYKRAFAGAVVVEMVILGGLLYGADLSNRTHLLLLAGFVGSYLIIGLAALAVGAHISRVGQRVLRAIESASRLGG